MGAAFETSSRRAPLRRNKPQQPRAAKGNPMEMIDLSRDLFHRTQTHPAHPPVIISWYDHAEKKRAGNTDFSSKALSIAFSDHAGTHVDAPVHFDSRPDALSIDQMPLEKFYTSGICLDLSHVPLRHAVTVPEMEAARRLPGWKSVPTTPCCCTWPLTIACWVSRATSTISRPCGGKRALAGRPGHRHVWCGGGEPSPRRRT